MIAAALGLELRILARSPWRVLVLLLVLGTGFFATFQGQLDVRRWEDSVEAGFAAQNETVAETRELFAAGEKGPEERPWVDLSDPVWQDWYAATRLCRTPAPLAGIAFAAAEVGTVAIRINRWTDPTLPQGARIENPELAAAGGLDLVTVLALLLPLMILALGVELGGYERATGILPMIRVQSGRDRTWLTARCIAVGVIGAAVGLSLVAGACALGSMNAGSGLAFATLVVAYVAVWTALLGAVALRVQNPSQGAVAMGAAWILLCVLVPAIGVERSAALAADDFAIDLTVEARDAGQAYADWEDEAVLARMQERFSDLQGQVPEDRSEAADVARSALWIVGLEELLANRRERSGRQSRLVGMMSLASPAVAFTHALEGLAGRGPEAARSFQQSVVEATSARISRYVQSTWSSQTLDSQDFEELLTITPATVGSLVRPAWKEGGLLGAWALLFVALAGILSRRRRARNLVTTVPRLQRPPSTQIAGSAR